MFDWFTTHSDEDNPENPEHLDSPTVQLTVAERRAFEALTGVLEPRRRRARLPRLPGREHPTRLPVAIAVTVAGVAWMLAWLSSSLLLATVGVAVQAVGLALVMFSPTLRRLARKVTRPAAVPTSTPAPDPVE